MTEILFESLEQEGTRAVVSQWLKSVGDTVSVNEPILEVETDKVTVEVVAPADGVLSHQHVGVGDELSEGSVLGNIEVGQVEVARAVESPDPAHAVVDVKEARPRLSPAVRRRLAELDLDAGSINGTGSKGRINLRDVEAHLQAKSGARKPPTNAQSLSAQAEGAVESQRIPHSPMRRTIADHMTQSLLQTAPHVTSIFEADLSRIVAHRAKQKAAFQERGVRLTYSAYFVRAATEALAAVPEVNSRFHDDYLELFSHQHIGVGAALGNDGIVVPVVRNAQSLNLFGTAKILQDLVDKARTKKLAAQDLQGGTFSISNHGVSGSLVATPIIINQPQSAILGIGKMEKRVVVRQVDGQDVMAIRPMCFVSLTIDHRALDAHQTNRFLSVFVEALEDWS